MKHTHHQRVDLCVCQYKCKIFVNYSSPIKYLKCISEFCVAFAPYIFFR